MTIHDAAKCDDGTSYLEWLLENGYTEVGRTHYVDEQDKPDHDRVTLCRTEDTCLRKMRRWSMKLYQQYWSFIRRPGETEFTKHERLTRRNNPWTEQFGFCMMDKGHRGQCSTIVYHCDVCGKARRGQPHRHYEDEGIDVCFMCAEVNPPDPW
jgi:hypothetical protein